MRAFVVASLYLFAALPLHAQTPQGYYRYPTIHGGTIVFAAEGDLWTVATAGGTAQRLTTRAELAGHPAISPDGRTLAFSASYEGPLEVYTMPLTGGPPVRRTYEGRAAFTVGWTPDGKLLYGTDRYSTLPNRQLVMLDLGTGERTLLPPPPYPDKSFRRTTSTGEDGSGSRE